MLHSNPRYDRGGANQAPARPPERCHPQGPGAHKWFAIQNLRPSSRPHHVLMHRPAPIRALVCEMQPTYDKLVRHDLFPGATWTFIQLHSPKTTFCLGAAPQPAPHSSHGSAAAGPNVDSFFSANRVLGALGGLFDTPLPLRQASEVIMLLTQPFAPCHFI